MLGLPRSRVPPVLINPAVRSAAHTSESNVLVEVNGVSASTSLGALRNEEVPSVCMMTVLCVCLPSHGESRGGGP